MKGGKTPLKTKGYTIVEVLIVLAVSGVMFVIASNFINGKQANTSFTQGVNELTSQIQGVADDVVDGKYSDVNMSCSEASGKPAINPSGSVEQGNNSSCIFRGKLVHFYRVGVVTQYEVIPLIDLRTSTGLDLTHINSHPSLVQQATVPQRLSVYASTTKTPVSNNKYNIGFMQGLGTTDGLGYKSGTQTISLVQVKTINANLAATTAPLPAVSRVGSFTLCVSDGTRYATIDVGGNDDNDLVISSHMGRTAPCPV